MAKQNLTQLDAAALSSALNEAKEELFNLRFQHVTGQLENNQRMGQVRKQIARIKTEIRSRELAAANSVEATND